MAHSQSRLQSSQQVARVANVTGTDTITRIKLDAANQALGMLSQGFLPFQIIEFMGGPYLRLQTPHPAAANARMAAIGKRHHATSSQLPRQVVQPSAEVSSFIHPSIETPTAEPKRHVRADSSTWQRIEPRPTGPSVLEYEDVPGTYTLMQQRFDQGDLAKTVEQQHLLYMMSRGGALSAPQTTPLLHDATPQAPRKISQPTAHHLLQQATRMGGVTSNAQDADLASLTKPAISQLQRAAPSMQDPASLVQNSTMATGTTADVDSTENVDDTGKTKTMKNGKKKLKLSIRAEKEATPDGTINQGPRCAKCIKGHKKCKHRTQPLGSSPFDASSTPPNYVPSADVPEGHTSAPVAAPDLSRVRPTTSVEVAVQAATKKAAPKRKR